MSAKNSITIIGNMGREPDMKYGASGTAVTKLSVAVNRYRSGEQETDWFNVVCFGQKAEFINQYGAKGRLVAVQGEMRQNRWQDDNGNNRTSWELAANDVRFLDKAPGNGDLDEPDDI